MTSGHRRCNTGRQEGIRRSGRRRPREHAILEGDAPRSETTGLMIGPELAVADGALGFWKALEEVWPKARGQRCWVHKTANLLNKLPKSKGKGQARIGADLDGRDQEGCFRRICRVR